MGFKEGFTAGLENLDQYIAAQFYLRKQNKPNNRARVTTYVNFPGNTEDAFNFYKSVFGGEFPYVGKFKDMPQDDENCKQMSEADGNKIMHVSLPISKETKTILLLVGINTYQRQLPSAPP